MKTLFQKLRHDRKGAAIEMAIMLMVITFALSTLVVTTSLLLHSRKLSAEEKIVHSIALEQIGQSYLEAMSHGADDTWKNMYPDYDIEVDAEHLTMTASKDERLLLTVVLEKNDSGDEDVYIIKQWDKN